MISTPRRTGDGPRLAAAVALFAALVALAPAHGESRPLQAFDIGRGLAADRVNDLAFDRAGYLWIATPTGVSRYDGRDFRTFDVRHGLGHMVVPRLLAGRDGRLWAGSNRGLSVLASGSVAEGGPFRPLPFDGERGGGRIGALAEDRRGTVWGGGDLGLQRVEGEPGRERLVAVAGPGDDTGALLALAGDPGGGLWAAFASGLFRRTPEGVWSPAVALPAAIAEPNGVNDLAVDGAGRLWVATRSGLCVWPLARDGDGAPAALGEAKQVPLAELGRAPGASCSAVGDGVPVALNPRTLRPLAGGELLAAAAGGVVAIGPDGGRLLYHPEPERPGEPHVALASDDGTLWIGTRASGLLRLPASGLFGYGAREGFAGNLSTLAVRGRELVVVTDFFAPTRRLLRPLGGRLVDVTPPDAARLEPTFAWGAASALGADGAWWATSARGLLRHPRLADGRFGRGEPVRPAAVAEAMAASELFRIFVARDGALWIAGDEPPALFRFDPATGAARAHPEVANLERGAPTAFAEAADGALWIGFYRGGLARLSDGRFEAVSDAEAPPRGFVYALRFDRRGRLWVATGGSGLVRLDDPAAARPVARPAVPGSDLDSLQIFDLSEDGLGRLLAATARGLSLIDPASSEVVETLTSADGLPVSWVSALGRTEDGTVWIGTERGVARWAPPVRALPPPPVRVAALSVAGRPWSVPLEGADRLDEIVLTPADRTVEIEVASPHLGAGAPPRFQWRVGESEWSAPRDEPRLRLAGLAPGRLRVEARAVRADGTVSAAPATVELRALPPLWRRGWFVALAAAAVVAALWAAYRLRVARLLALERVRTRIAADLHDDLGSSLSRISILAEVARRQSAARQDPAPALEEIGGSARSLAEMASDIVWAIDPSRDDLGSVVARLRRFGADLFEPLGARFTVEAPVDAGAVRLAAAARRDLYLLLKEGLNNAAKYAGAREVRLRFARAGSRLAVELADDGAGFDAEAPARAAARGGGHGLRSMRERAARLGGELAVDSRPGGGTRLALDLPL